jgi:hypothetical protein
MSQALKKRFLGALAAPPRRFETSFDSDRPSLDIGDYGVERRDNGNVVITLGMVPPFEVPAETAVKLACLLLKQAGAAVDLRPDGLTAKFKVETDKSKLS